jgi:hypothetical protein
MLLTQALVTLTWKVGEDTPFAVAMIETGEVVTARPVSVAVQLPAVQVVVPTETSVGADIVQLIPTL